MVQKRRLVKHSFWVKKTHYLAQRQNLWEYTGTIKNKHKFRMILFGLSRPYQSLWMSPACGQDYRGLPRLTEAYRGLPRLTETYRGLPRLTEAYPRIPKLNWVTNKQRMPMQCSPAVSLFKEVSIGNCLQWNSFCVHCSYIFKCQKRLGYSVPESNG